VWKHQLRWARTIRVCQPVPYFFSILSNAGLWALLWLGTVLWLCLSETQVSTENGVGFHFMIPFPKSLAVAGLLVVVRIVAAVDLQRRLTRSMNHAPYFWLIPIKDLLQAAIWVGAFVGNKVEWRGQTFGLRRDGTLVKR
jgi:ceramide glucosyltransferase